MSTNIAVPGQNSLRRPLLWESLALACVCTLDMISTLYLIRAHIAIESNPWMAVLLAHSDAAFLVVKGATYLVPITILELLRPVRPELVPRAMRACLFGYLALYLLGSIGLKLIGGPL
ncbi:hypothetical protein EON82_06635 [bacterium]|nr:MAG: hypothetical protein EON82_06635 [bacterium]